jgi:16S rRNA (cytidine1402-2'-O)-methyltransferase
MPEMSEKGKIYLVPTPIGNLGDITARALDALRESDIIACEDTRQSVKLLNHFGIKKKLLSYHDFNEAARAKQLVKAVKDGQVISIITDAGSPGISDPAYRIIRAAIDNDVVLIPLPGPNALIPALTGSGLPLDRFFFEGFLSNKSAARRNRFEKLRDLQHTLIFYESPHRIAKMISDALEVLGDREACIAREISKIHEEFIRGTLSKLKDTCSSRTLKGEIVVIIEGFKEKKADR